MRVLRDDVVRLCEGLGFVAAGQWKRQKMQDMLRKIANTDGIQDKDVEGDDLQALLHEIVVLKGDVEVVRSPEELGEAETKREEAPAEAMREQDIGPEPESEPQSELETEPQGEPADEATDEADCVPIHQPEPKKRGRKGKRGKAKAEAERKPELEEKPKGKQKKVKEEKASSLGGKPKVMGAYSIGPFVRWLASVGCDVYGVCEVLKGEGVATLSGISIVSEMRERRPDHPPADVTDADRDSLFEKYPSAFGGK